MTKTKAALELHVTIKPFCLGHNVWLRMVKPNGTHVDAEEVINAAAISRLLDHLVAHWAPAMKVPARIAIWMGDTPTLDTIKEDFTISIRQGEAAGAILNLVLAAAHNGEYFSLEKTFADVAEGMAGVRGFGKNNLKQNIWPEFRSVAHLWAARQILFSLNEEYDAGEMSNNEVNHFLRLAEFMRIRAISLKSRGAEKNILPEGTSAQFSIDGIELKPCGSAYDKFWRGLVAA